MMWSGHFVFNDIIAWQVAPSCHLGELNHFLSKLALCHNRHSQYHHYHCSNKYDLMIPPTWHNEQFCFLAKLLIYFKLGCNLRNNTSKKILLSHTKLDTRGAFQTKNWSINGAELDDTSSVINGDLQPINGTTRFRCCYCQNFHYYTPFYHWRKWIFDWGYNSYRFGRCMLISGMTESIWMRFSVMYLDELGLTFRLSLISISW